MKGLWTHSGINLCSVCYSFKKTIITYSVCNEWPALYYSLQLFCSWGLVGNLNTVIWLASRKTCMLNLQKIQPELSFHHRIKGSMCISNNNKVDNSATFLETAEGWAGESNHSQIHRQSYGFWSRTTVELSSCGIYKLYSSRINEVYNSFKI
jgi:hypothetical protein